jgi:cytochrome P450
MAGYETTSQTLAYTIWELACHPDIQNRLRQEIRSFGIEPSYDDFHAKLPFLDAVCRES